MNNSSNDAVDQETKKLVESLDSRDLEILKLKQVNRKITQKEIGKYLGISVQAVSQRMNNDRFKRVWDALEKDVYTQLRDLQYDAVLVYKKALKDPDLKIAMRAAEGLLKYVVEQPGALPPQAIDDVLEFIDDQE